MYIHPGKLFVEKFGVVQEQADVLRYAKFLRAESGTGITPPIELEKIYNRFGIQIPVLEAIDQEGLLVDPECGLILIKEDDPTLRQRFSAAHELIELLFAAHPLGKGWKSQQRGPFDEPAKERMCNAGAAEILMPRESFLMRALSLGISYQSARQLAFEYIVSITAALVQLVRIYPGQHAVVLWAMKNKPSEMQQKHSEKQMELFETSVYLPSKKLRVEWSFASPGVPYIPPDKSISNDTPIYAAWQNIEFTSGFSFVELGKIVGRIYSDNYAFQRDGETLVLSLVHLPNDSTCSGVPR